MSPSATLRWYLAAGFTVIRDDPPNCPDGSVRTAQTGQWLNKAYAADILHRFRAGDPEVTWRQVWLLVVFSLWHQIYVERVYDPVALGWEDSRGPAAG